MGLWSGAETPLSKSPASPNQAAALTLPGYGSCISADLCHLLYSISNVKVHPFSCFFPPPAMFLHFESGHLLVFLAPRTSGCPTCGKALSLSWH